MTFGRVVRFGAHVAATGATAVLETLFGREPGPACDHRYCARVGYGVCVGVTGAQMDMLEDRADVARQTPDASADTQRGAVDDPAGVEPTAPAEVDDMPELKWPSRGFSDVDVFLIDEITDYRRIVAPVEFDWTTWVIPAITDVLAEHHPEPTRSGVDCHPGTESCPIWPDWQAWREHVAPLIAARIKSAAAQQ